jgi:hypothetical protein
LGYATGLADQEFQQYYKNLTGLSTLGETAAAGGASTAQTGASLAQGAGNTQGSIYGNLGQGLTSTVNGLFNNPAFRSWISGPSTPQPIGDPYSPNASGFSLAGIY